MTLRYKLRTLLIVLALGPPVLALGWWQYTKWQARSHLRAVRCIDPVDFQPVLEWSRPNEGDPTGPTP